MVSGCDYISFNQIGKGTFLRYFFQYASFINGGDRDTPGTLADISIEDNETGYLSFLRLIGSVFFKKHASGFNTTSPQSHFLTFLDPNLTTMEQHCAWLENVRQTIWDRISFESEMIPSDEALHLHWIRSCWVIHMWAQADTNMTVLQPLEQHGWQLTGDQLSIVWDSEENIRSIRARVSLLTRGCKCVTGFTTGRCSCVKKKRQCMEGCECRNCKNTGSKGSSSSNSDEMTHITIEEDAEEFEDTD